MSLKNLPCCQYTLTQNLSGRAVKTQLQIVLIRLFAATDGYPISVKNEFLKNIFLFVFFIFQEQPTMGSSYIIHTHMSGGCGHVF